MGTSSSPAVQQPVIIRSGGSSVLPIALSAVAATALIIAGKKYLDNQKKNAGEDIIDTPEGQIALQLKTVFDSGIVSDAEYRRIAQQITPANKDAVYDAYKKLTGGRFLSDDISKRIKSGTQQTVDKQTAINATPGTLLKIVNDQIQFLVGKGDKVIIAPTLKSLPAYLKELQVVQNGANAYINIPNNPSRSYLFPVLQVKEVELKGIKESEDWTKYFRPYIRTRKVFAAIQIAAPTKLDANGKVIGTIALWVDARNMRLIQKPLKGIGKTGANKTAKLLM